MKTALVSPFKKASYSGCTPPIAILYLAAALLQNGEDVLIIDADEGSLSHKDILGKLTRYSPDLVGIPLFSSHLSHAYKLVEMLESKKSQWKILLGGPHATARPEEVLNVFNGCDFVLRGESEQSIMDLVEYLRGERPLDSINGLSYRSNGTINHNPDIILNMNLDSIPFPARELLASAYGKIYIGVSGIEVLPMS